MLERILKTVKSVWLTVKTTLFISWLRSHAIKTASLRTVAIYRGCRSQAINIRVTSQAAKGL